MFYIEYHIMYSLVLVDLHLCLMGLFVLEFLLYF